MTAAYAPGVAALRALLRRAERARATALRDGDDARAGSAEDAIIGLEQRLGLLEGVAARVGMTGGRPATEDAPGRP